MREGLELLPADVSLGYLMFSFTDTLVSVRLLVRLHTTINDRL
jgi:hypothetical protein